MRRRRFVVRTVAAGYETEDYRPLIQAGPEAELLATAQYEQWVQEAC